MHIGGDRYSNASEDAEILSAPIPPPPVFEPDMTTVQAQAAALVAKAPLPLRDSYGWHSQIQKLLNADDVREQKQRASPYPSSWDAPIFRSAFEKRRLRILNALFTCLMRCGMTPRSNWLNALAPTSASFVGKTLIYDDAPPACVQLLQTLVNDAAAIRVAIDTIEEAARVRGIWPGTIRELYDQYGLADVAKVVHE